MKDDVRVGDKKAVPTETLNDELQKYWHDAQAEMEGGRRTPTGGITLRLDVTGTADATRSQRFGYCRTIRSDTAHSSDAADRHNYQRPAT